MAKKTVRPPDFEGVLAERGKFWSHPEECVTALARHYGETLEPATFRRTRDQWRTLALRLAIDLVPAFRLVNRGGRPKRAPQKSSFFPFAHAARLVQIVTSLQRTLKAEQLPARRTDAYRELAKRLKKTPYPEWRYGALRKPSSFAQAWKNIPKDVKANPHKYVPFEFGEVERAYAVLERMPDLSVFLSHFPGEGLGQPGLLYWLKEQDRMFLAKALPPAPMR